MSLALFVPGRPGAPRNGLYFRMENDNLKQRFKNGLRMEILGDVAYMVYPRSRAKKSYTLKLTATDDASIIDWAPVDATRQSGRLEFACVEEVPGLLEDSDKFWKLEEEYPAEKVALRRSELQTQPPLALEDAMVTGNAAGTSAVRGGSALDWLGADPGSRVHAGPLGEVSEAASSSQRNVRPRIPGEHAEQHPLAQEGSAALCGGRARADPGFGGGASP